MGAGLAVQLASEWESRSQAGKLKASSAARLAELELGYLPPEYARGLQQMEWPGRSQVVEDEGTSLPDGSKLSFYIDGAHTPESMETCAAWFADQCDVASKGGHGYFAGGDLCSIFIPSMRPGLPCMQETAERLSIACSCSTV